MQNVTHPYSVEHGEEVCPSSLLCIVLQSACTRKFAAGVWLRFHALTDTEVCRISYWTACNISLSRPSKQMHLNAMALYTSCVVKLKKCTLRCRSTCAKRRISSFRCFCSILPSASRLTSWCASRYDLLATQTLPLSAVVVTHLLCCRCNSSAASP